VGRNARDAQGAVDVASGVCVDGVCDFGQELMSHMRSQMILHFVLGARALGVLQQLEEGFDQ
jgi:hypothetical protein